MKLSRRNFLKLLGLTPAVPFLNKDVFPDTSPSPTDVRVEPPAEKPDLRYWGNGGLSGASACFHVWPTGVASSVFQFPYWDRIRHDNR